MENTNLLNKFKKIFPYLTIILLAVTARIIPHPANFAPIGGLALFLFHIQQILPQLED